MNPLTNVKNIKKLSEQDLKLGGKSSWHDQYKDSAWIFIGGLPYDLTEGDIVCVFSQYGEVVNINLVRDKETGKQKGFAFLCYEDQRSTILAVDNLNSIKILGRTLRVDHVENYKVPKQSKKNPIDEETRILREEGCAPKIMEKTVKTESVSIKHEKVPELPPRLPSTSNINRDDSSKKLKKKSKKKKKESKKNKKDKKKKKRKRKHSSSSSSSSSSSDSDESSSNDTSEDELKSKRKRKK